MDFRFLRDISGVNWKELCELYRVAPLGEKDPVSLKETFEASRFYCLIYDVKKLIGVGRALADGHDCSYICDIALHPDYHGMGLGKKIVTDLIEQSEGHKKIILYANPGKEGFYAKLGFKRMNTAMAIFQNEADMLDNGSISNE